MRMALHDSPWRLAPAPAMPIHAPLDDPRQREDWLPARVPGSIHRDLMRAGRLPDLYALLDPEEALAWVHARDWWYEKSLPAIQPQQRAWLEFHGVDYQAAVVVHGQELGRGAGMFHLRRFPVTRWLRQGPTTLHVRVWGAWALPRWPRTWGYRWRRWLANRLQEGNLEPFSDRLLTLKSPVHFGWDFAPRLLPAGIWDEVYLHVAGAVALRHLWARADWGPDYGLVVRLGLDADPPQPIQVQLYLDPLQGDAPRQAARFRLSLHRPYEVRHLCWPDAELLPWNTHDRGHPHRYRLTVILLDDQERPLDQWDQVIGSRRFGWRMDQNIPYPQLNDQPLRLRGINWVPLDLLPGDPEAEARYRARLQAAVDAGVNAVRVWGGGGREQRVFYDLCDELGLLVWQEMPIACVFFERLPQDPGFLRLVRRETQGIIRSLRHHPSIFMWGGGNEWGPGRFPKIARAMSEIASREDPSRRWVPASPGPHDSHNWLVWHGKASPAVYAQDPAPLLSEFGLSAPPDVDTLRAMLPEDGLWPPGEAWRRRQAELGKLHHYARFFLPEAGASSVQAFVQATQQAQARGLQQGIEAYRLRDKAVGTFLWQWHEPWPAIAWGVWPYQGPPKPAYEQVSRSYAPLAPLARFTPYGIELWVVHDGLESPGVCRLEAWLGEQPWWEGDVSPAPLGRVHVHTLPLPPSPPGMLRLRLHRPNGEVLENTYPLPWPFPRARRLPWRARLARLALRWLLRW